HGRSEKPDRTRRRPAGPNGDRFRAVQRSGGGAAGDRTASASRSVGPRQRGFRRSPVESGAGERSAARHGAPLSPGDPRLKEAKDTEEVLRVEVLGAQHDRSVFESGMEPLDRYFRVQAGQDARKN